MCSIVGSFDIDRVRELTALNAHRGTHSHSFFVVSSKGELIYAYRGMDELQIDKHLYAVQEGDYIICHQQAPTTDAKTMASVHPAEYKGTYLWHNGIIKDKEVKRLQEDYGTDETWDTALILKQYYNTNNFDNLDGTFACCMYEDGKLFVFRNEISPLFYSEEGDISSTKFTNSVSVKPNTVWRFDPWCLDKLRKTGKTFRTVENPYYFGASA